MHGDDCVASLQRWMARDSFGQTLADAADEMKAAGDGSFTIRLKEPFPRLLDALAKVSRNVPFIMPERLAKTDPTGQWMGMAAYRTNLKGLILGPAIFQWNVEKI